MLYDLAQMLLGSNVPNEFQFLYAFAMLFFLSIFLKLIFAFIEVIIDFMKGF